jgi:hypothetical protein
MMRATVEAGATPLPIRAGWRYFGRVCQRLGRARSPRMPVVCERFRVVFDPDGEA